MSYRTSFIAFAAVLLMAGCQYKSENLDPTLEGFFPNDETAAKPAQLAELQAAAGARFDAMLHRQHFDGARLNSLGEEKLSLMLKDDNSPAPVLVYLNVDEKGKFTPARKDAVIAFLKDKGLAADQIQLEFGENPATRSPAARHLANQSKLEGAPTSGPGSVTSTTAGPDASGDPVSTGK